MESYVIFEDNTIPYIFGQQQQPRGVDLHMNMGMNGLYSNFGTRIISQLLKQNCGSRIIESNSSSKSPTSLAWLGFIKHLAHNAETNVHALVSVFDALISI